MLNKYLEDCFFLLLFVCLFSVMDFLLKSFFFFYSNGSNV